MASISLQHIVKVYSGGVTAVNDFNLEIKSEEFIVLVGPSGCGKSTVLRMIAGLEEITGGELYIGERLVNEVSPKDRDIAMVFQTYALYPHMTVYKNMAFSLELKKMPKDEIDLRVREAARVLDIEHLLTRKPKALSGGQRQRVALGRAMVRNPAVFLLDEPLSNLDAKLRASMRTELIKLHGRLGTTFVYVTHDQTEAMTMGDRIVVMKDGLVQQVDTPQNLYDMPCNVFVAGFIGSPQMNILKGVLHRNTDDAAGADGKSYVEIGEDKLYLPPEKCSNALLAFAQRDVFVGIRSEDLHDDEAFLAENPNAVITAKVDVAELMGSEVYLYLQYRETSLTARVAPNTTSRIGDTVKIGIDVSKIHLFDALSERNILI
ncbi:ABC transporter ATP-binding protein [Clostridia bacterium]|nr:ABC transporter ATP-binding protein [Clostridia bacterium]